MQVDQPPNFEELLRGTRYYYDGNLLIVRKPWWKGGGVEVYLISPKGAADILRRHNIEDAAIIAFVTYVTAREAAEAYSRQTNRQAPPP
ncbi:MAG: hypothetical protein ACREIA_05295, partial [Opitutaceae bacterium]